MFKKKKKVCKRQICCAITLSTNVFNKKGHFSLTKAGERYIEKEDSEAKNNRTETKLKQTEQKSLCWSKNKEGASKGKRR